MWVIRWVRFYPARGRPRSLPPGPHHLAEGDDAAHTGFSTPGGPRGHPNSSSFGFFAVPSFYVEDQLTPAVLMKRYSCELFASRRQKRRLRFVDEMSAA
jgi:hypothetical protein